MNYINKNKKLNKGSVLFKKKYFFWAFLTIFISIQVFFTIQTATSGAKLADLESKVESLSREKRILEDELVAKSSLTSLETKADSLGFKKNDNVYYITPGEPFASAN